MRPFILFIITTFSLNIYANPDIQDMIDDSSEGDTVTVPSGDYILDSTINLNKIISLECESECNINAINVSSAIFVSACGADVTGFNIVGGESTTSGIVVYNSAQDCNLSDYSTISSNNISGMALQNSNSSPLSYGILVWGDSVESTTNGVVISGNTISNVNGSGISLGDFSSDIEISNNNIIDINEVTDLLNNPYSIGIQSGNSTNVNISSNSFANLTTAVNSSGLAQNITYSTSESDYINVITLLNEFTLAPVTFSFSGSDLFSVDYIVDYLGTPYSFTSYHNDEITAQLIALNLGGVLNTEFILGCTNSTACNYDNTATDNDGTCTFVDGVCDTCENGIIVDNDADGDGVCDADEIEGCQDDTACNYNENATDSDFDSCDFAVDYYDCDGVCLIDTDGDGFCDELEGSDVQTIDLAQGWNIFSSNLFLEYTDIETVMSPLSSSLIVTKDDEGNVYWPSIGLNQIGNFELGKAYMSKIAFNSTIDFFGNSISPEDFIINLNEGWSFLGYLRDYPMDILQVFSNDYNDILSDIIIIKDSYGNVFWPEYNLNNIQTMYPGQGYVIKMSSPNEFSYLPNNFEYYNLPVIWPDSNDPLSLQTTAGNSTMMINLNQNEISLGQDLISSGDKIGIFYEGENKWICAGFLIWDETMPPAALTMWGNIENGFGLMNGDELKMFIYDNSTGLNYLVENTWNNQGYFTDGALGYINNSLYQSLEMTTELYINGFNARYGLNPILKSNFYDNIKKTSTNMVVAIPNHSWDFEPIHSTEIIAFDSYGNLVGSSVYDNASMSLIIWENDIYTDEKDGMLQGEKITLKYWNEDLDKLIELDVEWDMGDGHYISNGLAAIGSISLSDQILDITTVDLFPNPCSNQAKLSLYLSSDDFVSIKILDFQGRDISLLFSGFINKGNTNIEINTSKIKIGTYIISIMGHNFKKNISFSKI